MARPPVSPVNTHGKLLIMFYLMRTEVANKKYGELLNHPIQLADSSDPLWFHISITSPAATGTLLHFEKLVFRAVADGARFRRLALDGVPAYGAYIEFCFRQIAAGSNGLQRL